MEVWSYIVLPLHHHSLPLTLFLFNNRAFSRQLGSSRRFIPGPVLMNWLHKAVRQLTFLLYRSMPKPILSASFGHANSSNNFLEHKPRGVKRKLSSKHISAAWHLRYSDVKVSSLVKSNKPQSEHVVVVTNPQRQGRSFCLFFFAIR